MLEFLRRNQVVLSSGLFLTLSFALITLNRDGVRRVDPLGFVFLEVLRPLQSATTSVTGQVGGVWNGYLNLVGVEKENRRLRERLRVLEAERQRIAEIESLNERMRRLLDFHQEMPAEVVTARVTGKDATGWFQTFILDRGETDGVRAGMAVVSADGVVGRIAQSSPHAARVLVLTDHNSGVDALVQRTRARGIVEGTLSGGCSMKYIKRGDEIEEGDLIVTSGLDGIFPKGVLIGRVTSVTRKDFGLFQVAEVAPAVELSKLEEALVITSPPKLVNQAIELAEAATWTPTPEPSPDGTTTPAPAITPTPVVPAAAAPRRGATPKPAAGD